MIWLLINLILLVLLGVLGVASWLKTQQPKFAPQLSKLEAVEGWIGIAGLVWGVIMLLQWLQYASYVLRFAFIHAIVGLLMVLVVLTLSLILAMPQLRTLTGNNAFIGNVAQFTAKLAPFKMILGLACLFFAL